MRRLGGWAVVGMALLALGPACNCGGDGDTVEEAYAHAALDEAVAFGDVALGTTAAHDLFLRNDGSATLKISNVRIDGAAAASFTFRAASMEVVPRSATTITVRFRPSSEGPATASLIVDSNATDHPQLSVALDGNGLPAALQVTPKSVDFGELPIGGQGRRDVVVRNTSMLPVDATVSILDDVLNAYTMDGMPAGSIRPLSIEPNTTQNLQVTFAPQQGGEQSARLHLEFCGEGCGVDVPLTGKLVAPRLDINPLVLDFGQLEQGGEGELAATLSNHGSAALTVSELFVYEGAASFSVVTVAPLVIEPGAQAEVLVRFAPQGPGRSDGRLRVVSNDPRSPEARVDLTGATTGSDIVAVPPAIDFGVLTRDETVYRDVALLNRGDQPANILDVTLAGANFTLEGTPAFPHLLMPGSSLLLAVSYRPAGLGPSAGSIDVTTDSPGDELLIVNLAATRTDSACAVQASTLEVGFGAVRLGQQSERSYVVRNVGTGPCVVSGPVPSPSYANDPSFTFVGSPRTLQPGDDMRVSVRFTPRTRGVSRSIGEVAVGGMPPVLVSVRGRGVAGGLSVNPAVLDFGAVPVNCGEATRRFTLISDGADTVSAEVPILVPGAPFHLGAAPLPATMMPGQALSVPVTFRPDAIGTFDGEVRITGHIPDEVFLVVSLRAIGADSAQQVTEEFPVEAISAMDVLFVIDDSGSMYDNQDRLAQNSRRFIEVADFRGNVDYHLGVTTTDVMEGGARGALVGSPTYITRASGDATSLFTSRARVGTVGSGWEQGLEAARLALSPPMITGRNLGFLRANAGLAVVIVTDEEDGSMLSVQQYLDFLDGLKAASDGTVVVSAISGGATGCYDEVTGDEAIPAPRLDEAVRATGGLSESICSPDWGSSLRHVGESVFLARGRFRLAGRPDPATLVVTVNNAALSTGWTFDPQSNSVVFDADHLPPPGGTVRVTYVPVC